MRIITGDSNGYLKSVQVAVKEAPKMLFRHSAGDQIKNITWSSPESTNYIGFTSGSVVKTFDLESQKSLFKKELEVPEDETINGLFYSGDDIEKQTCVFGLSSGSLCKINLNIDKLEDQKQEELYKVKKRSDDSKLHTIAQKTDKQYLCLGQFLPQLYDIEREKLLWKGRNVPNDIHDLEVPLYDTDGHFLHGSTKEFIISNGFGKVRLYDISQASRPVIDVQASDEIIHKITTTKCGKYAFYARQKGTISKCDIRMNFRMVNNYKGPTGSVTDIQVCGDFLACVGYDRYLRVFQHESRQNIANVYLKQKLESILIDHSTVEEMAKEFNEKVQFDVEEEERRFREAFDRHGHPIRRKRKRNNDNMFEEKEKIQKTDEN